MRHFVFERELRYLKNTVIGVHKYNVLPAAVNSAVALQVLVDVKKLYNTVVPPKTCSKEMKQANLVALAHANLHAQDAVTHHTKISNQVIQTHKIDST